MKECKDASDVVCSIHSEVGIFHDLCRVLQSSGQPIKRMPSYCRGSLLSRIETSLSRVRAFILRECGPLRLFFGPSKKGGCVISDIIGQSLYFGKNDFLAVATPILSYSAQQLCAIVLQNLDAHNAYTDKFYMMICQNPHLLDSFMVGVGFSKPLQADFRSLLNMGGLLNKNLIDFLYEVYCQVEQERHLFRDCIERTELEVQRRVQQEGIASFYREAYPLETEDLKPLSTCKRCKIVVDLYKPVGIDFVYGDSCLVLFVGCMFSRNAEYYRRQYIGLEPRLRVFGNKIRLQILDLLRRRPMEMWKLAQIMKLEKTVLAHHIKILSESKYILKRRVHRGVVYYLNRKEVKRAIELLNYYGGSDSCEQSGEKGVDTTGGTHD